MTAESAEWMFTASLRVFHKPTRRASDMKYNAGLIDPFTPLDNEIMDKKAKKRLDVINKKLHTLRPRLAGSREQADDLDELKQLEDEVAALEAEAKKLKESK